jgi:hypothetical protein
VTDYSRIDIDPGHRLLARGSDTGSLHDTGSGSGSGSGKWQWQVAVWLPDRCLLVGQWHMAVAE